MTREEALKLAWIEWTRCPASMTPRETPRDFRAGFDAGWDANDAARDAEWAQIMEDEGL